MTDLEKLRAFAQGVMENWPGADVDAEELQQLAVKYGLLVGHEAAEPCGQDCYCAEFDCFPMTCYRHTALLDGPK